jgi:hypothetical protein
MMIMNNIDEVNKLDVKALAAPTGTKTTAGAR